MTTQADAERREHITLKAIAATMTDQGTFEAVISTEAIDREKDVVSPDGMVKALRKWPRPIPLAWEHSTKPEDIFGSIDPQSVKNVNGEVVARGQVDLESHAGREAWRSFKARSLGFSFAYLIIEGTKRADGGRNIDELDVFEITACRAPMNNNTRVLSTKTADGWKIEEVEVPTVDEQREAIKRVEREIEEQQIPDLPPREKTVTEPVEDKLQAELQEVKARLERTEKCLEDLMKKAEETAKEPEVARAVDPLRQQAEKAALEVASGGLSHLPHRQVKAAEPEPDLMDLGELKRKSRDLMLQVLSGVDE